MDIRRPLPDPGRELAALAEHSLILLFLEMLTHLAFT
jgi:hypothetical protein